MVLTVSSSTTKIAMVELDQSRLGGAAGMKPQMAPNARPTFTAGATPTIVRTSGSWLTDGFRAGMWIRVSNSTSNNGFFKIVSVTSTTVTIDASTPVTAESGDSEIVLEGVHLIQGDPALTFGGQNVTRVVGSWLADGFSRGQTVVITGTPDTNGDGIGDNDGERTVVDVTTTLLTLDAGSGLIGQTGVTGVKIWSAGTPGDLPIVVIDPDTALQPVDVGLTFAGSTITRLDGRNWADDGFVVGQFALVTGETANRGSYWVRTVSGTVLTLLTAAAFTAETDVRGVDVVAAAVFGSQSLIENQTGLTFDGTTVVRADGMSWSTEGFAVGQILVVKNTKTSDGSYRISALSGTTMTLASLTTTALSLAQENTANATTAISVSAVVSMRNATIVFADHGITRSRGSWTTDGFAAGDRISVRGGSANAGQYLIQSISADGRTLTVTAGTGAPDTENPLVTEGIYAVRVRGLLPFDQLTVGLFDDALSGRLLSGEGGAWMDLLAKIITQAPSATLTIADGAAITAVGGLTATVTATSVLKLSSDSVWLGISYARSNPTATLTVGAATLRAGGVLSLTSAVVNTMTVETAVSAGIDSAAMNKSKTPPENQSGAIPGPSITVTIGQATSTAGTTVGAGALLEGGTVTIRATVENEFEVSSESSVAGIKSANVGIAAGVVVSNVSSTATVTVNGTVRGTTSVTVRAESVNKTNSSTVETAIGAAPPPASQNPSTPAAIGPITLDPSTGSVISPIAAAAAVTVVTSANAALVVIGAGAKISSRGSCRSPPTRRTTSPRRPSPRPCWRTRTVPTTRTTGRCSPAASSSPPRPTTRPCRSATGWR